MIDSKDLLSTGQLVREAQTGEDEAFAALYRRYGALVFRTAYLLLLDVGRAEEITQDVFVQVYRKLGDYRSERGAFTTWLHRITVNACLNARRRRLFPRLSLDRAEAAGLLPPAGMPAPLELALRDEQQRRVCTRCSVCRSRCARLWSCAITAI